MAEDSKIEWTDHTFNPWIGCSKISLACDFCYAEELMDQRYHRAKWGPGQPRVRTSEANWRKPLAWASKANEFGAIHERRQRVFCASLADVFDNEVDPAWRLDLFKLIDKTGELDWLVLTKRIGNARRMLEEIGANVDNIQPHIWFGATIANREEMLRDAPKLKAMPAAIRFWSVEPMLGDLGEIPRELMPDWIIAGGESGAKARAPDPRWFYSLRDQCEAAGVPFLFKQWGTFNQWGERVGKTKAGRLLAGVTHDGFPESVG